MDIIRNDDPLADLPIKNGRDTLLRIKLLQLKVGEKLVMYKDEWQRKNPPYKIVAGVKKTHQRTFEYGMRADKTAWEFRRLT